HAIGDERPRATLHDAVLMCAVSAAERLSGRQIVHVHSRHGAGLRLPRNADRPVFVFTIKKLRTVRCGMVSWPVRPLSLLDSRTSERLRASHPSSLSGRFMKVSQPMARSTCGPSPNIRF